MSLDRWHIPTSDDEIVEVFLEEVGELLENIDNHLKSWKSDPDDKKALTEIRRTFHTLKGSGRMVKALDLSEMAWKVERMLNQALAGSVPVTEPMVNLVEAVRTQIPRVVHAFKNRRSIAGDGDIERLTRLADALAAGRKPTQVPTPVAASVTEAKPHYKLYEINLKLERYMQRADEALHRSEMALQQARRVSALSETPSSGAEKGNYRAELDRISELVNQLSKEVSDIRLESKKSQRESILQQTEINHLIGQRVRARLVPMEHLLNDIKRDTEENARAVAVLSRTGWRALVLSALVGGMIASGLSVWILSLG